MYGSIVNEQDEQIGTFTRSVRGAAKDERRDTKGERGKSAGDVMPVAAERGAPPTMKGTYTTRDGDSGDWE